MAEQVKNVTDYVTKLSRDEFYKRYVQSGVLKSAPMSYLMSVGIDHMTDSDKEDLRNIFINAGIPKEEIGTDAKLLAISYTISNRAFNKA